MAVLSEHQIQNEIRIALCKYGWYVFRTNAGKFWQGKSAYDAKHGMILTNLRAVEGLPRGFSDLIAFKEGKTAFIECKTENEQPREDQARFLQIMEQAGFIAGVARSPAAALELVGEK